MPVNLCNLMYLILISFFKISHIHSNRLTGIWYYIQDKGITENKESDKDDQYITDSDIDSDEEELIIVNINSNIPLIVKKSTKTNNE